MSERNGLRYGLLGLALIVLLGVLAFIANRPATTTVASVRYGTITLTCPPQTAALLRYDSSHILTEVNAHLDQPVKGLQVRVDPTAA